MLPLTTNIIAEGSINAFLQMQVVLFNVNTGYKWLSSTVLCTCIILFPFTILWDRNLISNLHMSKQKQKEIKKFPSHVAFKSRTRLQIYVFESPNSFHKAAYCFLIDDGINLSGGSGTWKWCLQEALNAASDFNTSSKDGSVWFCVSKKM